jgi:adhesin transport system outer membrane protein
LERSQQTYVEALSQLRDMIVAGVEVGKRAKIEELKAENDLQGAKGQVLVTQSSLRMLKSTLESLTYKEITSFEPIDVMVSATGESAFDESSLDKLERFKLQDLEIAKSDKMIAKVNASSKPQVALAAYAGYNYDLDQIDPLENDGLWQIGLNVKWNVFDFGVTSSRVQQAKIAKLQAIAGKDATTEGYKKLFANAQNEITSAQANYLTNQSQYNLLQESERIEQARYDVGVSTLNDLLLAKSKTALADSKMIQSKYAYQNGLFYLDYLLERGEQ